MIAKGPSEGSSYTRKWPNATVPAPATLPPPPSPHPWPHGELPAMSGRGREDGAWVLPDVRTPPPSGQLQTHSPSLDTHEGQGDGIYITELRYGVSREVNLM